MSDLYEKTLEVAVATFAASAKFQEIVGAVNAEEAKASIFTGRVEEEEDEAGNLFSEHKPPLIILRFGGSEWERDSQTDWVVSGELWLTIHIPREGVYSEDYRSGYKQFVADCGTILQEAAAVMNLGGFLACEKMRFEPPGMLKPEQENGEYWWEWWGVMKFTGPAFENA